MAKPEWVPGRADIARAGCGPNNETTFCVIPVLALALALLSSTSSQAGQACWSGEELRGTSAELSLHRGGPSAGSANPLPPTPADRNPPLPRELRGLITSVAVSTGAKPVALTFDLCEGAGEVAGYDGRVVDLLRARSVRATFFAGGKWMRSHRERAMQLLCDPLFEVGNHSFSHKDLGRSDAAAITAELLGAQSEYRALREALLARGCLDGGASAVPAAMSLLRLPYGSPSREALDLAADMGLATIQWDVAPGDPAQGVTAEELVRHVAARVRPGSIVVLHANAKGRRTAEALPRIIETLAARGYEFVRVSDLLKMGRPNHGGAK